MNQAQQLLARGAAILAKQSAQAEEFTLNGEKVWANCSRTPNSQDPEGARDTSTEEGSVIEWPLGTRNMPERGSLPVDSFGFAHRVKSVQHVGHALRLNCEVTR
jgi:hypothetical protein